MPRNSFIASMATPFTTAYKGIARRSSAFWLRFRALKLWQQALACLVILAILGGSIFFATSGKSDTTSGDQLRTVTLATVSELSGSGSSVSVIGTVRSITEASLLAQAGGTVRAVHTSLGSSVGAGSVLAELENASERAQVLSAEGSYDAAIAARADTGVDAASAARNLYRSSYSSLDTILTSEVDTFFGENTAFGPRLLINPAGISADQVSKERAHITDLMNTWRAHLATADTGAPETLLNESQGALTATSNLLTELARAVGDSSSNANTTQRTALAAARSAVDGLVTSVSSAGNAYQAQKSSTVQTGSRTDASVKVALGSLRLAQANLEKTLVRAPIGGTVNFFPIHVGDYVTAYMHVATVAQNGALEIVAYVSEDSRALLTVGTKVTVEESGSGIVTSIAPALDPVTKQIEVHIAVSAASNPSTLVNGQSVRIGLPSTAPVAVKAQAGPLLLPLTALKLTPSARVVFSIGTDGRLVSHAVEIGDVRGDRIEIRTALPTDLRIVTDARGLSEGQLVNVATTAVPSAP